VHDLGALDGPLESEGLVGSCACLGACREVPDCQCLTGQNPVKAMRLLRSQNRIIRESAQTDAERKGNESFIRVRVHLHYSRMSCFHSLLPRGAWLLTSVSLWRVPALWLVSILPLGANDRIESSTRAKHSLGTRLQAELDQHAPENLELLKVRSADVLPELHRDSTA